MNDDQIADYVREHTPELDPKDVIEFMREHAKPTSEPGTPIEWAVRLLRQRGENELGDGPPVERVGGDPAVDRVADELRRRES